MNTENKLHSEEYSNELSGSSASDKKTICTAADCSNCGTGDVLFENMIRKKENCNVSRDSVSCEKEHTYMLLRAAAAGDEKAREQIVKENSGLVSMAARKFVSSGNEYEDLMQLGYIGLLKAIDRFNPDFQVMFSTYAVPMIIGEIRRFLRDDGRIKISRSMKQDVKKLKLAEEKFLQKNGRSPKISELADIMGISPEETAEILYAGTAMTGIASMDDETFARGTSELLSDDNEEKRVEIMDIKKSIDSLDEREKKVILLRYFRDKTQQETGMILGISQVQVSRIEKRVLENLRKQI